MQSPPRSISAHFESGSRLFDLSLSTTFGRALQKFRLRFAEVESESLLSEHDVLRGRDFLRFLSRRIDSWGNRTYGQHGYKFHISPGYIDSGGEESGWDMINLQPNVHEHSEAIWAIPSST